VRKLRAFGEDGFERRVEDLHGKIDLALADGHEVEEGAKGPQARDVRAVASV
jgi:hypothetical protein